MSLKIPNLRLQSYLPGANEFKIFQELSYGLECAGVAVTIQEYDMVLSLAISENKSSQIHYHLNCNLSCL